MSKNGQVSIATVKAGTTDGNGLGFDLDKALFLPETGGSHLRVLSNGFKQPDYYERLFLEEGPSRAWAITANNARILQRKLEHRDAQIFRLRQAGLNLLHVTAKREYRLERMEKFLWGKKRKEIEARRALCEAIESSSD